MLDFLVPQTTDLDALMRRLVDELGVERERPRTVERTCYDTFDWRIGAAGYRLIGEQHGRTQSLVLDRGEAQTPRSTLGAARSETPRTARRATARVESMPRFVWDLPHGALRSVLEPIVQMRALLPQVCVRSAVLPLCERDAHRKVIVRLTLEQISLREGAVDQPFESRLRLSPLRGYAKAARRTAERVSKELGLTSAHESLLESVLRATGRRMGDYSSKIEVGLDPSMRSVDAVRVVLRRLREVMDANIEGMRADLDSEFLHDFRVAVRRTRTALGQIRGVLPERRTARFRTGFRWLGQLTGPARDLDVYLLGFETFRSWLPELLHGPFEPLRGFLEARRDEHRAALLAGLGSERGRRLLSDWRAFLEPEQGAALGRAPGARRSVAQVARESIWRAYRKALKQGRAIHEGSAPSELHELRKTCKKLRYLMEFFRCLFAAEAMSRQLDELKGLQQILGDVQDLEVQAVTLMRYSTQMSVECAVEPETLMAVGALVEQLRQKQLATRSLFAQAFSRFTAPDLRAAARTMFKPTLPMDRGSLRPPRPEEQSPP